MEKTDSILHSSLGEKAWVFGKLKYMKDFDEKPSIYKREGIKYYVLSEGYIPIGVYSIY